VPILKHARLKLGDAGIALSAVATFGKLFLRLISAAHGGVVVGCQHVNVRLCCVIIAVKPTQAIYPKRVSLNHVL
jgi:hypothetical protein